MFYFLFSLIFAVVALLFVLNGMRKGGKYVWSYSLARLIAVIISAIASAFLSAGISLAAFRLIFSSIAKGSGRMSGLFQELPIMADALCALASMIVAPILFYFIFCVLRYLLTLMAKIILRSMAKKKAEKKEEQQEEVCAEEAGESATEASEACEESSDEPIETVKKEKKRHKGDGYFRIQGQKNPWGKLVGAICGLVLFFAMMIPAVGMFGVLYDVTSWATAGDDQPGIQKMISFVDAGANNIGSKAVRTLGGNALYSVMTTYEVGDAKVTLAKETKLLGTVGHALSDMTRGDISRKTAADSFREIDDAFRDTALIPQVLPDLLSASKESWDRGEAYYGLKKPSFGKMDGLVHPILRVLGTSTQETIGDDVGTIVEMTAYMIEKDAMTHVKQNPMTVFEKEEVTEEVIVRLLVNDHLAPLVGDFTKFGLVNFGEALGTSMEEIEPDSSQVEMTSNEAQNLSHTLAYMTEITEALQTGGFTTVDSLTGMGGLLDGLVWTETVGKENTDKILIQMMTSPRIRSVTGLDHEQSLAWAERINEGANTEGYKAMLVVMSDTLSAAQELQK